MTAKLCRDYYWRWRGSSSAGLPVGGTQGDEEGASTVMSATSSAGGVLLGGPFGPVVARMTAWQAADPKGGLTSRQGGG